MEYANGGSLDYAQDRYIGEWKSNKDYAMETFIECNEIPDNLLPYIDWNAVTRDYMMDVVEINGYYFIA